MDTRYRKSVFCAVGALLCCGLSCIGGRSPLSLTSPGLCSPLPTRLGLQGKGMVGRDLARSPGKGRRGRLPNVSVSWNKLSFPGGRSSPNSEAGLNLLGSLSGLQFSWRSPGRLRCSLSWDVGPDVPSAVWPLSAPCAPGISYTWQCQVTLRGC